MAIPEGYVPLGLVGFTDQGDYKNNVTYMHNDLVHVNNSIWKCKADNTIGIVPAENASWTIFISSTTSLNGITAVDTKGIMGGAGEIVVSQALIDALATKVMESIPVNKIVNHFLATDPTMVLSGPMGKTLKDQLDKVNSDLTHTILTDIVTFNTTYASASACSAVKYGGLVDFQLWIVLTATEFQTGVEYHIGYINNPKYYPHQARTVIFGTNNGVATRIDIGKDGVIKITPYGKITGGTIVFPFCYTVQ